MDPVTGEPTAPFSGDATYWLSAPRFERIVLDLTPHGKPGAQFTIEAPGASRQNRFIQAAALNGSPLDLPRLLHREVVAGGTLHLTLGPDPSNWGAFPACSQ